ncbi:MAG: preprotein translocase subunit YajC [Pigmentiphaga sp.]
MSISEISTVVVAQMMGGDNALLGMLPIILMFVVLYFLMIRPQMKRQKEHRNMVSALAKGDEVITAGGLVGKITDVKDNYVTLEIAQDNGRAVEVVMQRVAVQTLLPKGTLKSL